MHDSGLKKLQNKVYFFEEQAELPPWFDKTKIEKWILLNVSLFDSKVDILNYIFCSDDYLLNINNQFLQHNYYTDIITFPFQQGSVLEGDIFISLDRVTDNAQSNNTSIENECLRVIAHGFLHLIGYKDKSPKEVLKMREAEDKCLSSY